jgi:hypothetical protein
MLVALLKLFFVSVQVSNIFVLIVCLKLIDFVVQIFLFCHERRYIIRIISIHLFPNIE